MTKPKLAFLCAGGTGGHLFPAQALAEELNTRGWTCHLLTDERGLKFAASFPGEKHVVPSATLKGKSPIAIARMALGIVKGMLATRKLMKQHQPAILVGFGGYPSLPPMLMGLVHRTPTMIHEQNGIMGLANRLLAKRVGAVATGFPSPKRTPDMVLTAHVGNPIRQGVQEAMETPYKTPDSGVFNLLVFGGSQGASVLNQQIPKAIAALPAELREGLKVTQQVREEDEGAVRAVFAEAGVSYEIAPFFNDLPQRMAEASLIIARSGASTVAELAALGRPSILVPLKQSREGDQAANAAYLVAAEAALVLPQDELINGGIEPLLLSLLQSPQKLGYMAENARHLGKPNAALDLADLAEKLAQ